MTFNQLIYSKLKVYGFAFSVFSYFGLAIF